MSASNTEPCQINCDAATLQRLIDDAVRGEKEENERLRSGLEYLKSNFPANECLQDKCREVLGDQRHDLPKEKVHP